jgi:hypothetical protein
MEIYLHDSPAMFQFVLRGMLSGDDVPNLEHAWITARSVLMSRDLVLEVSGMTGADASGMELLSRMRNSGAQLTAEQTPQSEDFLRSLSLPLPTSRGLHKHRWASRFCGLAACESK